MKCPHCKKEINPAKMLGELSASKRDTSPQAMSKLKLGKKHKKVLY